MGESTVQIVDGTRPFGNPSGDSETPKDPKKDHPSLEPEIDEYEFEPLGDDFEPGKNPGDSPEAEVETDGDPEPEPDPAKADPEPDEEEPDESYLKGMEQTQQKMLDVRNELDRLKDQYDKPEPQKPADEYDDSAMRIYEARKVAWETARENALSQIQALNQKARVFAREQEVAFREKYPTDEVGKFESFMKGKPTWYYAYISGEETLEDLFRYFKAKQRPVKIEKKAERQVRIKPIKPTQKTGKAPKATTETGIPAKFKYANLPMFKGYAKELKAKRYDIAGNRMTDQRIDELCRQEYKIAKGESIL